MYLYGSLAGLMVGIAGLSGGGPVLAGLLMAGEPLFKATATSSYVIGIMCLVGALIHSTSGQVTWSIGIPLMIGAILGAFIAPKLVTVLKRNPHSEPLMQKGIGLLLVIMGIKSLF